MSDSKAASGPPTVLVANRGEVACRIVKSIAKLGFRSAVVYADCDSQSLHVSAADVAVGLGVPKGYTDVGALLAAAKSVGASAVHPGYGFISENPDAARAFEKAGIAWIGPTSETIELFGLKHTARELAISAGIPVLPGSGVVATAEDCVAAARSIGYPALVKATGGGGGMGQVVCFNDESARRAFESAQALAANLFSDARVFVEKYIQTAKHIEVQIFGDGSGNVVALGERECSLQRRRQKVVEESPSPFLDQKLRKKICDAAVALTSKAKYRSAGTVEFLVDIQSRSFYFLEVNTRLQVEHGVTELVHQVDIVDSMILLALSPKSPVFPKVAEKSLAHGHAFEARIYAENPLKGYIPSPGTLTQLNWPAEVVDSETVVRIDTWAKTGTAISSFFDPLIGKVLVWGKTRASALEAFAKALKSTRVAGVAHNIPVILQSAGHSEFINGLYTTSLLENMVPNVRAVEVLVGGLQTSLQDYPGRIGYWPQGVSPSGAMDAYSMRMGNAILGNDSKAVALEMTLQGPTLKFHEGTWAVLTGTRLFAELDDGRPVPWWKAFYVDKGSTLKIGGVDDGDLDDNEEKSSSSRVQSSGKYSYLCVSEGFDAPFYLGSASTFPTGNFGGIHGGFLKAGDLLPLKAIGSSDSPSWQKYSLPQYLIPVYQKEWIVGALAGPHFSEDFILRKSLNEFWTNVYEVDRSANRLGVRLKGPAPSWTRTDGGDAGLHPSNLQDYTYPIGAVNLSGNTPIVLMVDGPSLGGFVCPITVAATELWKIAQARPGDKIRFREMSWEEAQSARVGLNKVIESVQAADLEHLEKLQATSTGWSPNHLSTLKSTMSLTSSSIVKDFVAADGIRVVYRVSGDENVLIEYGVPEMDLKYRIRVHAAMLAITDLFEKENPKIIVEMSPGVRSVLVHYDPLLISLPKMLEQLLKIESSFTDLTKLSVPSRLIKLPLSFADKWTIEAQERYTKTVRSTAPYLPSNVEFVRRINGLESLDKVSSLISEAQYLVLGLGDVYLGAPCAVPVDPRHRLVTSKYNPARTYTPEGAVGIGGSYMCIYGMDSPGGYQLVGRTLPIWDTFGMIPESQRGSPSSKPWLLNWFDRVNFFLVSDDELVKMRSDYIRGAYKIEISTGEFSLATYNSFLKENADSIKSFQDSQGSAFNAERERWEKAGEGSSVASVSAPEAESLDSKDDASATTSAEYSVSVTAGMTAAVWTLKVANGDKVSKGQPLVTLESMKVEIVIDAPVSGVVSGLSAKVGDRLNPDKVICRIVLSEEQAFGDMSISHLRSMYALGVLSADKVIEKVYSRVTLDAELKSVFLSHESLESLKERAAKITKLRKKTFLPLYGIPFAVKDNIDRVGVPTTAACPEFSYIPTSSAPCVQLLEEAGAIYIGKTNLDQFATGLTGCRSPYGIPKNAVDKKLIPGGSSSGSAVAVATGVVSFALGTDTAGSGRVPAALNSIVGLKPSKGFVSTRGVVPACRSVDCVTVFAKTPSDSEAVLKIFGQFDPLEPFSRRITFSPTVASNWNIGLPTSDVIEKFCDPPAREAFGAAITKLSFGLSASARLIDVDISDCLTAGKLLYSGAFVAERFAAVGKFIKAKPEAKYDPTVKSIILNAEKLTASDAFASIYSLAESAREVDLKVWQKVDVLILPTIPRVFTLEEVSADPLNTNSALGTFTTFCNLLDMTGISIPAGKRSDSAPFGITILAPAGKDAEVINLAKKLEKFL